MSRLSSGTPGGHLAGGGVALFTVASVMCGHASGAAPLWSLNAPSTKMIGGPSPARSNAIAVPSCELTVSCQAPLVDWPGRLVIPRR